MLLFSIVYKLIFSKINFSQIKIKIISYNLSSQASHFLLKKKKCWDRIPIDL